MWEARAESSTVYVDLPGLGNVDFFASWAEVLETRLLELVTEPNRQDFLPVAKGPGAGAVNSAQELLVSLRHATG